MGKTLFRYKRVLVIAAVEAEREAVLRGLGDSGRFDVCVSGVGAAASAASAAEALAQAPYDLVMSAGIGGGFAGVADMGSLVIATETIAADLGAETAEGFRSVEELGFGRCRLHSDEALVRQWLEALQQAGAAVCGGPVLTVSTATGTAETALELAERVPGAAAEAMEGYGVAIAARRYGAAFLEIRAISNPVGPRDRNAWQVGPALTALEGAFRILLEVLA